MFEHIERIWTDLDNPLCNNLRKSIEVIENAVRIFDTNQLAISFNGGKDATVVLHLVRYVFFKLNILDTLGTTAPIIYFDDPKTFPEMTEFLIEIKSQYNLQYTTYDCSFKDGVMDMTGKRGVKAIFMGVREGDPHAAGAEHMHPSSRSWPAFMRVYPILTWTHSDVWTFLKACHVPYCTLYDRGYTSIGLTHNTIPHPALRVPPTDKSKETFDPHAPAEYLPAHLLAGTQLERGSRLDTPPPLSSPTDGNSSDGPDQSNIHVLILYDASRMSSYISRVLQHTTAPRYPAGSVQVTFTAHRIFDSPALDRLSATVDRLAKHNDVIVLGDYSDADWAECGVLISAVLTEAQQKLERRLRFSLIHSIDCPEDKVMLALEQHCSSAQSEIRAYRDTSK